RLALPKNSLDPLPVVREQVQHGRTIGFDRTIVHRAEFADDRLVALAENPRLRVESSHDAETGRCRADRVDLQVGTIFLERRNDAPDVSGPEVGRAVALGAAAVERAYVIDQDRRARRAVPLEIDE